MWLSPVRALVWGARGRQFESAHPDKSNNYKRCRSSDLQRFAVYAEYKKSIPLGKGRQDVSCVFQRTLDLYVYLP